MNDDKLIDVLTRIADALERAAPNTAKTNDLNAADAFVWHADTQWLEPIDSVNRVEIELLKGIEHQQQILVDNTDRFAKGLPANNALLWGARGTGKSSLVKAVHAEVRATGGDSLALVEIHREDIPSLPTLLGMLRESDRQSSLKAVLEGGIEGRPTNVIFYATSNRRHLMPRDMMENERSTAINPSEAVEEKVSLSDRFGLWLGFHNTNQSTYLEMIQGYIEFHELFISEETWRAEAIEWSATRGSRSGRVAWQYIQDLAGRLGKPLKQ